MRQSACSLKLAVATIPSSDRNGGIVKESMFVSEYGGRNISSGSEDGPNGNSSGPFDRDIFDRFDHSWKDEPKTSWLWIPKNAGIGEKGFPAAAAEIAREGWRTRRVVRVQ